MNSFNNGNGDRPGSGETQPSGQSAQFEQNGAPTNPARPTIRGVMADFKPWQAIRRHKWRVVSGVTFAVALATAYAILTGPWYESTAQLLVRKKHLETAPISGPNAVQPAEDYLGTHILIMTSPRIAKQAVANGKLQELHVFQKQDPLAKLASLPSRFVSSDKPKGSPEDALASRIAGSLKASVDVARPGLPPSHEVLTVSFQGTVNEDCNKVLEAVIASYQDFLKETYQDVNAETLELITRARDVLQKDIETKEAAYLAFCRDTPLHLKTKDGITVQQDRLFNIDSRLATLRMRHAEISASLEAIEKVRHEGGSHGKILALLSGLPANQEILTPTRFGNTDPAMASRSRLTLDEELLRLQLREKELLESYGPANPEIRSVRNRIRDVSELMNPSSASSSSDPKSSVWDENLVSLKIRLLEQELEENERADKALSKLFQHDQADAKATIVYGIEDEAHRTGIERSKLLYDSIVARLREIDSVRNYGGFNTQIIAAPDAGLNKKKYAFVLLGALLFGLFTGCGWACLAEFRDKSFRTSREISDQLGLPVVGHIPSFTPRTEKLPALNHGSPSFHPSLCAYHQSNSPEAEAYLAVRVALYHMTKARDCRVIQITSPIHGEGKTTLAANLAISMAQSGQRVILIDADLRRPRLADLFGVSKEVGLTSVLSGDTDPGAAIQPSAVPGLSILGSGPLMSNPAEAVASPRLKQLLDSLRQQCDYVLIDTPPLLAVTDAQVVARAVDGVLLTLRNSRQSRPLAQSVREMLDASGANVLGVVVNGVRNLASTSAYGYGRNVGEFVVQ
jgi:capsular exopolysaccharide synthesis family protein